MHGNEQACRDAETQRRAQLQINAIFSKNIMAMIFREYFDTRKKERMEKKWEGNINANQNI